MNFTIPVDTGDLWYYANDGMDMETYGPIYTGESFTAETEKLAFKELTVNGSDFRHFGVYATDKLFNKNGDLVGRVSRTLRNAYKKIIDGSKKPTFAENMSEWCSYFPKAHYTTDEEWAYIQELWKKEKRRGAEKLYWEDVKIGDEPAWTCSGPISYMDMIKWYGGDNMMPMDKTAMLKNPGQYFRDQYGMYLPDFSVHFGTRNVPGSRMVFYNGTACQHVNRMITNYIGDSGFVTRVAWYLKQLFREMQVERPGGEYLDLVPYMKGRSCNRHGSEGDTVIGKGYVTKKYINDKKEHIIDLTCWGETLDGDVVQVVAASVKLPSKKG
jgi:hypothetical protein